MEIDPLLIDGSLSHLSPVEQLRVERVPVQAGAKLQLPVEVKGSHPVANAQQVGIGQAGEPLDLQVHGVASGAAPANRTGEDAGRQVQVPPVGKHRASVHPEPLAIHEEDERQPVGKVDHLGVDQRMVVEDTVDKGGRSVARVALLETPSGSQVAVANGEERLSVVEGGRVEGGLGDVPVAGCRLDAEDGVEGQRGEVRGD